MEMSDAVPVYIQSDHDALIARHGGEPVALLRELDEARNRIAELEEDLERMTAARNRDHQQALANGAALASERERLEEKKLEVDAAMDCYKAALNAMRKDWREMFESTQAAGVELAAERERREAADKILRDIRNRGVGGWVTSAIDAHFARYKRG